MSTMNGSLMTVPPNPNPNTTTPPVKKRGGGPQTPEGKARSSQNAIKHGGFAVKYAILKTEPPEVWHAFVASHYARFAPADEVEKSYVDVLAQIEWTLLRLNVWEAQTLDNHIDALHGSPFSPGPAGAAEQSTAAFNNAAPTPAMQLIARRHAALIRARASTLKALKDLRRDFPLRDPHPAFIPDPVHDQPPTAGPEPAPPPPPALTFPPQPTHALLLPPFSQSLLQNLKKRTPHRR